MELPLTTRFIRVTMRGMPGYLAFTVAGAYDFEDFKTLVHSLRDESLRQGSRKVVVDIREVTGDMPNIDRYNLGQLFAQLWGGVLKAGIVAPADRINKLFENTAVNRYAQVLVHGEEQAVLDWLLDAGAD